MNILDTTHLVITFQKLLEAKMCKADKLIFRFHVDSLLLLVKTSKFRCQQKATYIGETSRYCEERLWQHIHDGDNEWKLKSELESRNAKLFLSIMDAGQ